MKLPIIDIVDGSVFNCPAVEQVDGGTYQVEIQMGDDASRFVEWLEQKHGYIVGEDYEMEDLVFSLPVWLTKETPESTAFDKRLPINYEVWAPGFDCSVSFDPSEFFDDSELVAKMYALQAELRQAVEASLPVPFN